MCLFTLACNKINKVNQNLSSNWTQNDTKMLLFYAREECSQNTHTKLDLSMELYDRITRTPLQVSVSVLPMVKAETS